jgi:hypothetical protein
MRSTFVRGQVDINPSHWDVSTFCLPRSTPPGINPRHLALEFKRVLSVTLPVVYTPLPPRDDTSIHVGIFGNLLMPLARFGSIDTLIIDVNISQTKIFHPWHLHGLTFNLV